MGRQVSLTPFFYNGSLTRQCRVSIPLVDAEGRIFAVLAGQPVDENWPEVQQQGADCLEEARLQCNVSSYGFKHRRGAFPTLRCGVSYGGGQTKPQNLCNGPRNQKILEEINGQDCFKRIARFASGTRMLFKC